MNALLTSPSLGLALLGLVVAAIVAMHRMKPRAVRRVVASTWLWEVAARRAGMRQSSWRWWLGLSLRQPGIRGAGDGNGEQRGREKQCRAVHEDVPVGRGWRPGGC